MKHLPTIAGALLGLLFIAAAATMLFDLVESPPPPPEGSATAHFFAAFGPTGYLTFVKVLELVGGALVALPKTRNLGLLILVPILVNILAFHIFVAGDGIAQPMILTICGLTVFLLLVERAAFWGLVSRGPARA